MKYLADVFEEPIRSFDFKVVINLSSLEYDISPQATSNSENAVSNLTQTYNGRITIYKWLLVDGYNKLDGSYRILPSTPNDVYEIGYMSGYVADANGNFTTYPYVEITFSERPIQTVTLTFEEQKQEHAEDFIIELYDAQDTLLASADITGNTQVTLEYDFGTVYDAVAKMKVIFKKWSLPNTVAKLNETNLATLLEFTNERILGANIKEKLYSQTGLGGIIAKEIDINFANHDKLFNQYEDYLYLNRNLRAYIRSRYHGFSTTYIRPNVKTYNGFTYVENEPVFEKQETGFRALLLDGTDYLEIPNDAIDLQNKSFSIESVIRTTQTGIAPIFLKYSNYAEIKQAYLYLNNGVPTFEFFGNVITGDFAINDDKLHYLAVTWDNATQTTQMIIDTTAKTFAITPATPTGTTAKNYENYIGTDETNYFVGYIDSVKVKYYALTEEEYLKNANFKHLEYDETTEYLFNLREYAGQQWINLGEFFTERFKFNRNVLNVYAKDRWKILMEKEYFAELKQNQTIQAILEEVLDYAGLDSTKRVLADLSGYTLPYVFLKNNVASIVQNLTEIVEYCAYFDVNDYKLRVDNNKDLLGEIDITIDKTEDKTLLANRVETSFSTFDLATNMSPKTQEWEFNIEVGTTRMRLGFDKYLTNTTLTVNSAPPGATITVIKTDIAGIDIEINTPTAGTVNLSVSGKQLAIIRSNIVLEDTYSISRFGLKTTKVNLTNVANAVDLAQKLATDLINAYSDPKALMQLKYRGNPYLQVGKKIRYNNNEYILLENVLNFKGGLQGRLRARRVV